MLYAQVRLAIHKLQKKNYLDLSGHIFDKICFSCFQAGKVSADGSGERDFLKDRGGVFISFLNVRVKWYWLVNPQAKAISLMDL